MHEQEPSTDTLSQSRSTSPDSPLASSLFDATANIDDLTNSLANFSRVSTPEPAAALTCCCGKEECEHLKAWQAFKAKLESRLILSAGALVITHVWPCFPFAEVRSCAVRSRPGAVTTA